MIARESSRQRLRNRSEDRGIGTGSSGYQVRRQPQAFPVLLVCFDCGMAQLAVPEEELRKLAEGRKAGAGRINES